MKKFPSLLPALLIFLNLLPAVRATTQTFTNLHNFTGSDGSTPYSRLVLSGGSSGNGVIFASQTLESPQGFRLAIAAIISDDKTMSNREIAIDLIQKLPENASLHDIAREIEFVAGVREGFEQLERGEGVPAEKVREMLPSWIVK